MKIKDHLKIEQITKIKRWWIRKIKIQLENGIRIQHENENKGTFKNCTEKSKIEKWWI